MRTSLIVVGALFAVGLFPRTAQASNPVGDDARGGVQVFLRRAPFVRRGC